MALSQQDKEYWLKLEGEIISTLVDLADFGFVIDDKRKENKDNPDPRCLIRPEVADALNKARSVLPAEYNFKLFDGWRPWVLQEKVALTFKGKIRQAHPGWTLEQVDKHLWKMAPAQRIVPRRNAHRYGGAVDISIVGPDKAELNMGVRVHYVEGPESELLFYELKERLTAEELLFRKNRRLLIYAMDKGGFDPYLPEFWHWGYRE